MNTPITYTFIDLRLCVIIQATDRNEPIYRVVVEMADAVDGDFDPSLHHDGGADDSAPSLGASRNANQQQATDRIVKRRNRRPVVCKPCRERRSKCSREKPCSICTKRNEAHLCVYVEAPDKSASQAAGRSKAASSRVKQLEQLSQLEELFKTFIGRNQPSSNDQQGHFPYPQQPTPTTTDVLSQQTTALDPALPPHWSSLFQQLRSSLEGYEDNASDSGDGIITSEQQPVLLGNSTPQTVSSVLRQYLPQDKGDVDRRLNTYFAAPYIVIPVIHSGKFLNEYEDFWVSMHDQVDPVWLALLFVILSMSAHITGSQGNDADILQQEHWLTAAAQCLDIAGYTKPRPYLLAALIILAQSQYMRYLDPSREVSLIVSLVTRLAYQSGLHREPGPTVSPFEAEMRRRLWIMIRHFDCMLACQFGIPASIQFNSADIQRPRNLLDDDIHEASVELPPSRPDTDLSPISSFILKDKYMVLFAEIYSHAVNATSNIEDESDIARLEAALQNVRDSTPNIFKPKPIAMSLNDPDHLRMFRVTVDFLYQKARIILHRRRMAQQLQSSYSTCSAAAMSIIDTFSDLTTSLHPGKLMEGKIYMLSATTVNDFLLACMTLCMAVMTNQQSSKPVQDDHLNALETARTICTDLSVKSRGALRVLSALTNILVRSGRDVPQQQVPLAMAPPPQFPQQQQNPLPAYQPAQPYSLNGFSMATNMPPPPHTQQPLSNNSQQHQFPSPTPSSALSQERSTSASASNGQQSQGQYQPLSGHGWLNNPHAFLEGQPIMAGVFPGVSQQQAQQAQQQQQGGGSNLFGATASDTNSGMDPFERLTMAAAAAAAQSQSQGDVQGGQGMAGAGGAGIGYAFTGPTMGMVGVGEGGEVDWSAFDSYITEY